MQGALSVLRTATDLAARARDLFGVEQTGLDPASLLDEATQRSRLDAPFTEDFGDAFATLVASLEREADLDAFGTLAARTDLRGKLVNLKRMDAAERRAPLIRAREVHAPIVITGLPRSGTSFLHSILARHAALLAPRTWQVIDPLPDDADASRARVSRELRFFGRLVPDLLKLHPLSADAPQECSEILGHVFRSLRYETTFSVPTYRAWLASHGLEPAYRFHRRFLQHLQGERPTGRWVLKSPDHVFCLASLRSVYPDVVLVFVHRDPARVLASVARLTELLRMPFAREVDRLSIGRQVLGDWMRGMRLIIDEADRDPAILHVRYDDLVVDPVGRASAILDACGLDRSGPALASMEEHVAGDPSGGYGTNRYQPDAYGIDPTAFADLRAEYLSRFELPGALASRR